MIYDVHNSMHALLSCLQVFCHRMHVEQNFKEQRKRTLQKMGQQVTIQFCQRQSMNKAVRNKQCRRRNQMKRTLFARSIKDSGSLYRSTG
mmetsp:Transcript_7527/g.16238  ORF Transcript_7527/g.16238 Transcript_7527/m.16238 type:complete len:90 (+) Transcript_7527:2852-3121(+)